MASLQEYLFEVVGKVFEQAGFEYSLGVVATSERPDLGQFQINGALVAAKQAACAPREVAESLLSKLQETDIFDEVSVAGPGFINVRLKDAVLTQYVNLLGEDRLGLAKVESKRTVIDYGGPNVAKPLHVGHLRSGIIGESLKQLHRFMGDEVFGDIHLGDWGLPMGMLITYIKKQQPELPYFDAEFNGEYPAESPVTIADLERLYPESATLAKEDESFYKEAQQATAELQAGRPGYRSLWQHFVAVSVAALKEDFDRLDVTFDWWYGESHYQERILPLIEKLKAEGRAVESEGALIVPLDSEDSTIPPLILVKSDGAFLYSTTDLATIDERINQDQIANSFYVVDQRQALHFRQVFAAAKITGLTKPDSVLQHLGFGTVNGPDGKPFKTRAGGVMKLKELIELVTETAAKKMQEAGLGEEMPEAERGETAEKVGIAALKFADLSNNRVSDYIFDLERFTRFDGKTGPYLIYTAVRIRSILRKAASEGLAKGEVRIGEEERTLALALTHVPTAIEQVYLEHFPHVLCEALFSLCQEFNRYYEKHSVLHEENKELQKERLALFAQTLQVLETGSNLLGIAIPERM